MDAYTDGTDVTSTFLKSLGYEGFAAWTGTSFAAVLVSGTIAVETRPGEVSARAAWERMTKKRFRPPVPECRPSLSSEAQQLLVTAIQWFGQGVNPALSHRTRRRRRPQRRQYNAAHDPRRLTVTCRCMALLGDARLKCDGRRSPLWDLKLPGRVRSSKAGNRYHVQPRAARGREMQCDPWVAPGRAGTRHHATKMPECIAIS